MKKVFLLFWLLLSMQPLRVEVSGNYSNFLYYEAAMKSGSEVRITPDTGGKKETLWSFDLSFLNKMEGESL